MRKIQGNLFDQLAKRGPKPKKPHDHFGGTYLKNYNPKSKRPMDSKKALHVVLRSTQATGTKSFKCAKFEARIWEIIDRSAKNAGIRIYSYANGGNHVHLLIRAKQRDNYNAFIRAISGLIARLVGRSERGRPLKTKFWDGRPFSRVVSFAQRDFQTVKTYLLRNTLEAVGWLPYVSRRRSLPNEWKSWLCAAGGASG